MKQSSLFYYIGKAEGFDSRLNDVLDPTFASNESKMDSRIQRLLFVATTLGLCKYDDVDLIRGVNTKPTRQAAFIDQLLDNVCIMDAAEDPTNKALCSPGIVSDATSLDEQFRKDCLYIDSLVQQEKMDALFNLRSTLLPPDLQQQVEISWAQQGHTKDRPPKPDLQKLTDAANKLAQDLGRQKEILEELTKTFQYQAPDESRMEKISKTMQLVLSELSQLEVGFSYCYENEMCHWCNKTPPTLNQLGPAFKRVHTLLQQFVNLLEGFKSIRSSYMNLSRDSSKRLRSLVSSTTNATNLASVSRTALSSFQDCVSVLERSLQRQELETSMSSSIRSSSSSILRGERKNKH
ncbi:HAUS augmin-like complex subunit 7 [Mizuhopecten yessoensis]|uniref:HAUS augmin-like complex subunit 7 n=1 Tax=Mizuhopecten yessoensis TaxID=6573 RepID=A0A210PYI9_MIZYE|nr:HAUS augmin-like complex subunit 7 [Mizuhopecten yessoensis]